MGEVIGGTVIQRSFVGRETANIIHIATVPVSELGIISEEAGTHRGRSARHPRFQHP